MIDDMPSLVIDIDPSGNSTQPCDLRISGNEADAAVVAKVTELLKAKGVI